MRIRQDRDGRENSLRFEPEGGWKWASERMVIGKERTAIATGEIGRMSGLGISFYSTFH